MRAGRLVGVGPVDEVALLVVADGADGVGDVVEDVVVAHPALLVGEAAREEVHAIRGAEGEFMALGINQVLALGHVDVLVLHLDGPASDGLVGGRVAGVEVVPGIVADVVGALGLVDAEEVQGAALVGEGDADVGAGDGGGPVGDAVGVDFAAEDADGGGVAVVGGGPDGGCGGGEGGLDGEEEEEEERQEWSWAHIEGL